MTRAKPPTTVRNWMCTALAGVMILVGAEPIRADENASNPLAAVNNTDLRYQQFDLGSGTKHDVFVDGAYMFRPDLKFKYELHYNSTDITGTDQSDFEKLSFKLIHFPSQRTLASGWGMRTAIGLEWILDLGDTDTGIGPGADQLAPFAGVAFANPNTGLTLIPLVQHFASYSGRTDISQTALRLIALQPFARDYWAKLDLKAPYDWENATWPATAEIQIGYNINQKIALYGDLLVGLGSDRPFDQGFGLGLRFKY